jgi:hypothetical protein
LPLHTSTHTPTPMTIPIAAAAAPSIPSRAAFAWRHGQKREKRKMGARARVPLWMTM